MGAAGLPPSSGGAEGFIGGKKDCVDVIEGVGALQLAVIGVYGAAVVRRPQGGHRISLLGGACACGGGQIGFQRASANG